MQERKAVWITVFVICIVLTFTIWMLTLIIPREFVSSNIEKISVQSYNNGWNASVDSHDIGKVEERSFVKADSASKVTLTNKLPQYDYQSPTLLFRTFQQEVEVYINGEKVYSYGDFSVKTFIQAVPARWNFVPLPQNGRDLEISIVLSSEYVRYAGYIPEFIIGSNNQCYSYIYENSLPGLMLSLALIFIVLILLVAVCFAYKETESFYLIFWWGMTVLLAGMWSLSSLSMGQFLFSNPYVEWLLRNTAAYFIVPSLLKMIYEYFDDAKTKQLTKTVLRINLAAVALCMAIQLMGLFDLTEMIIVSFVFFFFAIVVFAYGMIVTRKNETKMMRAAKWLSIIMFTLIAAMMLYVYKNYAETRFDLIIRTLFVAITVVWTALIIKNVINRMKNYQRIKKTVEEKQLTMMLHQIKPHFIYNTLGAIRAQIDIDPAKASEMIYDFSKYLRAHVDTLSVDKPIPFEDELANVKTYAKIERTRFGEKINVVYEIECTEFLVPPLTVQPLVENAITHGLRKKAGGGTVIVRAYETKTEYIIEVTDNGAGFETDTGANDAKGAEKIRFIDLFRRSRGEKDGDDGVTEKKEDNSSGIKNIEYRISAMSGGRLEISSEKGAGTTARVILPKTTNENDNG